MSSGRAAMLRLPVVVLALTVILGGCNAQPSNGPGPGGEVGPQSPVGFDEGIEGSGAVTTETHDLGGFERLVFASEGEVLIVQSGDAGLTVTADHNLHQYIDARVEGGALIISTASGIDIDPTVPIVFRVGVGDLAAIEMRGAGALVAEGLAGGAVSVFHEGVGDVVIDGMAFDTIAIDHGGVGSIRLTGRATDQQVSVWGAGVYDGGDLVTRTASVNASGLGEATVWATDKLTASASASGVVRYYGAPVIDEQSSDLGAITAAGDK